MQDTFMISVVFRDKNKPSGWSSAYSYTYDKPIAIGRVVVVPTGDFLSCGRVVASHPVVQTTLESGIKAKAVYQVLDLQVAPKAAV